MSGTFGDRDKNNVSLPGIEGQSGAEFYTIVDATTGKTTLYKKQVLGNVIGISGDSPVASIEPGGTWKPEKDFEAVFNKDGQKIFATDKVQKAVRAAAEETAQKGCEASSATATPEGCRERTSQLLDNGKATTTPNLSAEEATSQALNDLPMSEVKKTRRSFGNFRYPIDMDPNQDVMKFTMLKYEVKDLMTDGTFGFGNRDRVGPEGGARATGTVVLPIQSGIKDQNGADWGDNKMNAVEAAKASVALGLLGDEAEADAIKKVADAVGSNSPAAKEGFKQIFAAKASGVTGLIKRTKGAAINPNLELLFNEPTLRPFSFSFKLSARSKKEAESIVKIIRFFKQGMAPIRTESNLFLLAPHTFQIHYLLRGAGEHPFIGKMKECALLNMTTDYTPENNYSTLKDGVMTSYTITMEFKELEPIFNDDYESDTKQQFASFREDPEENAALQEDFANGSANDPLNADIGF